MGAARMEVTLLQQDCRETGKTALGAAVTPAVRGATPFPVLPITIGAGQAVVHRGWAAAREAALAALRSGPCVVVVVGAPGTGKTLLLDELACALDQAGVTTVLHRRGDLGADEATTPDAQAAFWVMLVDEADRIDEAALGRLAAEPTIRLGARVQAYPGR